MLKKFSVIKTKSVKDNMHGEIKNPLSGKNITEEFLEIKGMHVENIESIRPFDKNGMSHKKFKEDISVVFIKDKNKSIEYHVIGNCDQLINECNDLESTKFN